MTMQDWINANFLTSGIGDGNVIIGQTDNGYEAGVNPTWLSEQLGTIVPPTYAGLSVLPIAKQGWQSFFDQWKANSLVS